MNNIIIGQYIPGNSFLYRMDPRSKILALMVLMVSTFILVDLMQMGIMLLVVFVILGFGGIPIARVLKGLRPVLILILFTFTFQVLFVVDTQPPLLERTLTLTWITLPLMILIILIWYFTRKLVKFRFMYLLLTAFGIMAMLHFYTEGPFISSSVLTIYKSGVEGGFYIMTRLVIIITLSTILTLTTKPTDLNLGLEQILKPFSYIGLNAEELAMIISIALRYIPTLLDEANKIMLAQASRGVDFSEGKFKDKVMQIISLLVPMFIISFKRSDELANAMEARNFVPGKMRTRIHTLSWRKNDTATMVFVTMMLAASITLRLLYG